MDTSDLPRFLHRLRFLSQFSLEDLEHLSAGTMLKTLSPGEILFREGEQNLNLFVIARGSIVLGIQVPNRGSVPILTLEAGDMLGWSAMLGTERMEATATAGENVQVAVFPAEQLRQLCESKPEIGNQFMRQMALALARRLLSTREELKHLLSGAPGGA